jgi:hypothetical protein
MRSRRAPESFLVYLRLLLPSVSSTDASRVISSCQWSTAPIWYDRQSRIRRWNLKGDVVRRNRSFASFVACSLFFVFAPDVLRANTIPITNFSFEADVLAPGAFDLGNVPGWTGSPSAFFSTFHPTATQFPGGVPDGVNVAAVQLGSIFQTLSATLTANTQYTLMVGVGQRADFPLGSYLITLEAGGSVLALESSQTPSPGTFATSTISFLAAPGNPHLGQALTIRLAETGNGQVDYDFVRLDGTSTAAIPEPASATLIAAGFAALTLLRRSRQSRTLLTNIERFWKVSQ